MDTRQVIDESVGPYSLSASFNSDNSCFSVGLDTGFCGKSGSQRSIALERFASQGQHS
jgi:hypothetical protein